MAILFGYDASGNGNNWTANNLSSTAGAGNDSMVDSPTSYGTDTGVGGEVRGNYCTLNPLDKSSITTSNGNLDFAGSGNSYTRIRASVAMTTGKWYAEFVINTESDPSRIMSGIMGQSSGLTSYLGTDAKSWSMYESATNILKVNNNSTSTLASSNSLNPGDVQMFAYDADAGKLWFGKNGSWFASGNPSSGTNETFSSVSGEPMFFASSAYNTSDTGTWNFGQRAFAYTAPSGFSCLVTTNLPTPTIGATSTTQAGKYMNPVLYTGNGAARSITGVGFQPDFVWIKSRSNAYANRLADAVRGVGKEIYSNETTAETTNDSAGYVSAFNSDGFSFPGGGVGVNGNGSTYVAWNWNAGGSTVTNTSGTISSQVRASTTSGFSIVTYTGNGIDGATVGHGLGVVPSMVIQKRRDGSIANWRVWHTAIYGTSGVTSTLYLNTTDASTSDADNISGVSSTTFTTRGTGSTNPSGNSCVAYVFAAVAGYSAFGSYTGNGSSDGPFVYTGFRPEFVMIKVSSAGTNGWQIRDVARDPYNTTLGRLYANLSNAEATTSGNEFDILSNGFKVRNSGGDLNSSSQTYIYMAFAEFPFKFSLAR